VGDTYVVNRLVDEIIRLKYRFAANQMPCACAMMLPSYFLACVSTVMAVIHHKCKNVAARAAAWRRTSTNYGRGSFSFLGYISALNKLRSLYVMSSLLPTMDAASLIEASSDRLSAA